MSLAPPGDVMEACAREVRLAPGARLSLSPATGMPAGASGKERFQRREGNLELAPALLRVPTPFTLCGASPGRHLTS